MDTPHPGQDLMQLRRKEHNSPYPPICGVHSSSVLLFGSPPGPGMTSVGKELYSKLQQNNMV